MSSDQSASVKNEEYTRLQALRDWLLMGKAICARPYMTPWDQEMLAKVDEDFEVIFHLLKGHAEYDSGNSGIGHEGIPPLPGGLP